ncbi:MAG: glycine cleavage system aminomethyltransferase GcvT, partial [Myxococcales bacterium]
AWEHIVEQKGGINVRLKDISSNVGLLSVQGPGAEPLLQPLTRTRLSDIAYYHFTTGQVAGAECFISRTGYTGEDGFELYCRERDTVKIWDALLAAGATPIGLGARDSLRTEMGYALYGNEIDDTITPLEAGLGWIVKLDKPGFVGAEALRKQKAEGLRRKLVGFKLTGKGIARHGYPVLANGKRVGEVTSGTMSPVLKEPIGLAYVPAELSKEGTQFDVEIRGKPVAAQVVKTPFVTKEAQKSAPRTS